MMMMMMMVIYSSQLIHSMKAPRLFHRVSGAKNWNRTDDIRLLCFQGKGLQLTYWLHGKKGFDKPLPAFDKFV